MNIKAGLLLYETYDSESYEFWTCATGLISSSLVSLYMVLLMATKFLRLPRSPTPFLSKLYVPFTLSSGLRLLLDQEKDPDTQHYFSYKYVVVMFLYLCLEIVSHFTRRWRLTQPIHWWTYKFFNLNFLKSGGSYKKCVRVFDTLGSILALIGLIFGISSLILDQYDLEFELESELKAFEEELNTFYNNLKDQIESLEQIYKELDFNIECKDVLAAWEGTMAASLIIGAVPGIQPYS